MLRPDCRMLVCFVNVRLFSNYIPHNYRFAATLQCIIIITTIVIIAVESRNIFFHFSLSTYGLQISVEPKKNENSLLQAISKEGQFWMGGDGDP